MLVPSCNLQTTVKCCRGHKNIAKHRTVYSYALNTARPLYHDPPGRRTLAAAEEGRVRGVGKLLERVVKECEGPGEGSEGGGGRLIKGGDDY